MSTLRPLTESELHWIKLHLHCEIQFYNRNGKKDNNNVLRKIIKALRDKGIVTEESE